MKGLLRKNSIIANVSYFLKASNFKHFVSNYEVTKSNSKEVFFTDQLLPNYMIALTKCRKVFQKPIVCFLLPCKVANIVTKYSKN